MRLRRFGASNMGMMNKNTTNYRTQNAKLTKEHYKDTHGSCGGVARPKGELRMKAREHFVSFIHCRRRRQERICEYC